jgi:hypothetical protein
MNASALQSASSDVPDGASGMSLLTQGLKRSYGSKKNIVVIALDSHASALQICQQRFTHILRQWQLDFAKSFATDSHHTRFETNISKTQCRYVSGPQS